MKHGSLHLNVSRRMTCATTAPDSQNRELKDSSQKSLGEIVGPSEFSRDFHENG